MTVPIIDTDQTPSDALAALREADAVPAPRARKRDGQTSEDRANLLREIVEDRKAENVELLDLRGRSLLADYFLICTGTSSVQIRAISNAILERVDEGDLPKPRIEGQQVGEWILLDFADVVVHVMDEESRAKYRLEQFWTTAQPKGALLPTEDEEDDDEDDEDIDDEDDIEDDEDEDDDDDDFDDEDEFDDEDDLIDEDDEDEDDDDPEAKVFVTADAEVPPIEEPEDDVSEDPLKRALREGNATLGSGEA